MRNGILLTAAFMLCLAGATQAAISSIDQVGQQFSKKTLSVKAGDTVRYQNGDDVTHNINIIDAADVTRDMGLQKPGEQIPVLFDKAGKFTVHCGIHPKMKMVVTAE